MKLRFAFTMLVFLLPATAFGHDADWYYAQYQKYGSTDRKWDALVREGIDHWLGAWDKKTNSSSQAELVLSVNALEKAYAAGCRSPIALFIDGRNLAQVNREVFVRNQDSPAFVRLQESLALTENKPDLAFIRILCANALAWQYMNGGQYKEAIPYFEMALSLSSSEVEEAVFNEARAGLQQAKAKLAARQDRSGQLSALTLPPNPTKEQARAYVRQFLLAAGSETRIESWDPGIAMLEKVGPENLDVILQAWASSGQSVAADYYAKAAVTRLARAENKPLLLKWLPLKEALAEIMLSKGWVQDMRPFLVARIAERSDKTDVGVLQAAAALRDPATYDDLVWHFENNQNGLNIYDDIKNLPGIQLKDAVVRTWAASKSWTGWKADRRCQVAAQALDYGMMDALEFAVVKLDSPDTTEWFYYQLRRALHARTGVRGSDMDKDSDKDIHVWFEAHKGKFVFDENRRMFIPTP